MAIPTSASPGPIQLPKITPEKLSSPAQIAAYLNELVRALEKKLNGLYQLNNAPFVIDPPNTVSTSIAGDTASFNDLRDFTFTVVNALKSNSKIN